MSVLFLLVVKPYVDITWQRVVGWGVAAYNTPLWFLKTLIAYQLVLAGLMALRLLPRYPGWRWCFWRCAAIPQRHPST